MLFFIRTVTFFFFFFFFAFLIFFHFHISTLGFLEIGSFYLFWFPLYEVIKVLEKHSSIGFVLIFMIVHFFVSYY